MSIERDELAELVRDNYRQAPISGYELADVLLESGYRKACAITTAEDLSNRDLLAAAMKAVHLGEIEIPVSDEPSTIYELAADRLIALGFRRIDKRYGHLEGCLQELAEGEGDTDE